MQSPDWTAFPRFAAAGAIALAAAAPAYAAPNVIASLAQPPGGLACSEAVNQTQVVFDFKEPRSDLKQISVFVNGKGLPESAISEDWPRLTVLKGLHPGRNTVEVYATGPDNKTEAHTLTVLAGEPRSRNDKDDVAIVDCVGPRSQVAERDNDDREVIGEASDDADEVIEDVRPHVDDDVDEVDRVVYEDAPVYVYYPYPAFRFVSFFPAYYYPAPYGYYGYYGYRSYPRYYYGGHSYGGYGGYRGGYNRGPGNYWRGHSQPSQPTRPPTHSAPPRPSGHGGGRHGNY